MLILLRLYFLQHWFHLSDPGADDALDPAPGLRGFCGIDLDRYDRRCNHHRRAEFDQESKV